MTTHEALATIREQSGIPDLSYWQLRYLIKQGQIPAPKMNSSLVWYWTANDVENAVRFLKDRAKKDAAKAAANA